MTPSQMTDNQNHLLQRIGEQVGQSSAFNLLAETATDPRTRKHYEELADSAADTADALICLYERIYGETE